MQGTIIGKVPSPKSICGLMAKQHCVYPKTIFAIRTNPVAKVVVVYFQNCLVAFVFSKFRKSIFSFSKTKNKDLGVSIF